FAGKDDWESAQIDAWVDQLNDFNTELRPYFIVVAGYGEGDKDKLYKEVVEPARDKIFPLIVKQLKANGSGFLVGSKVSWLDVTLSCHIETFLQFVPDYLDKYPEFQVKSLAEFFWQILEPRGAQSTIPATRSASEYSAENQITHLQALDDF
ncbi:unnamed protein product, partial [Mesorhabditis spiculigera]